MIDGTDIPVDPASKRQRIESIVRRPGLWRVCEGCNALVKVVCTICPFCHAYRFDGDHARVIAVARALGKKRATGFIAD